MKRGMVMDQRLMELLRASRSLLEQLVEMHRQIDTQVTGVAEIAGEFVPPPRPQEKKGRRKMLAKPPLGS